MSRPVLSACVPLLLAVTIFCQPALAQFGPPSEGKLSAHAFAPAPPGAAIVIDALDDTDLNLRIRQIIRETLISRGYTIAPDGAYTLTFETQEVLETEKGGNLGELMLSTDQGINMHMNLWSNTRDSLLSRKRENPALKITLLRLDMSLRDNASESVIWQGEALAEARGVDRFRVFRGMTPFLIERLGESVETESFAVR